MALPKVEMMGVLTAPESVAKMAEPKEEVMVMQMEAGEALRMAGATEDRLAWAKENSTGSQRAVVKEDRLAWAKGNTTGSPRATTRDHCLAWVKENATVWQRVVAKEGWLAAAKEKATASVLQPARKSQKHLSNCLHQDNQCESGIHPQRAMRIFHGPESRPIYHSGAHSWSCLRARLSPRLTKATKSIQNRTAVPRRVKPT